MNATIVMCRLCEGRGRIWRNHQRTLAEREARAVEMRCAPEQTAPVIPISLTCSMCEGDGFTVAICD